MAAQKSDRKLELDQFLKTTISRCDRCKTCNGNPETVDAIKIFLAAKNNGKTTQSLASFHRFLVDHYDYGMGITALFTNVSNCLKSQKNGKH